MKRKLTLIICVILCLMFTIGVCYGSESKWTNTQNKAHEIAEIARSLGLEEDNPIILEAKKIWECDKLDTRIIANTVYYEAKYCTDLHQQLVAQVVLNRVNHPRFPDTVTEVIEQPNQYAGKYTQNLPSYANCDDEMKRCFENALMAIQGNVSCPSNVIYQSNFPQLGSGYFKTFYVNTGYFESTTYFAYE